MQVIDTLHFAKKLLWHVTVNRLRPVGSSSGIIVLIGSKVLARSASKKLPLLVYYSLILKSELDEFSYKRVLHVARRFWFSQSQVSMKSVYNTVLFLGSNSFLSAYANGRTAMDHGIYQNRFSKNSAILPCRSKYRETETYTLDATPENISRMQTDPVWQTRVWTILSL